MIKSDILIEADPLIGLVDQIVASYGDHPVTSHIEINPLPNRHAIIETTHLLRELLFPGYFGRQNLSQRTIEYHVGRLLVAIREKLGEQIRNAFAHQADQADEAPPARRLSEIVTVFLQTIPRLRRLLATDVKAAFDGDPAAPNTHEIIFSYPGLFAITVYRLAHELHRLQVPIIPRIMTEYAHGETGIDIGAGAQIDESFFIDHGTAVVIGETTVIGKRVKIYQGVTLGALSTRGGQSLRGVKRHPTLEDDVTVYSNAAILGGSTVIGQGVVVSSNVFVTQSVPAHTRVTVKNPELQYRDQKPQEFKQNVPFDWVI